MDFVLNMVKRVITHSCMICDREFQNNRTYSRFCGKKCRNYAYSKKYWTDMFVGLKIDPHNPPSKTVFRRFKRLST
jgi:hypothetical protein